MSVKYFILLGLCLLFSVFMVASTDVWCSHVTAYGGWKTTLSVYSSPGDPATFQIDKYDASGNAVGPPIQGTVPACSWVKVGSAELNHEGYARLMSAQNLLVKATYQFGDSPSVCEFFLTGSTGTKWVIPNSVQPWMDYTGLALINPTQDDTIITVEAWQNGVKVSSDAVFQLTPKSKYVHLSNQIWNGIGYEDLDTIIIHSSSPIPPPISITGNNAQDRHLFFLATPQLYNYPAGGLVATDPIVCKLRYVPPGTFLQGSPVTEPCRDAEGYAGEAQFTHTLSRHLAVMETEVTQWMWETVRASDPTIPANPSFWKENDLPVDSLTWYQAILFANRLSIYRNLTPCYYIDAAFTSPITAANYQTDNVFCDWDANGFRLPSEGEWEYFCRAGTTTPFWINEPNYTSSNCGSLSTAGMYPILETVAWFNPNSSDQTHPVGLKTANPWNLRDIHGNIWERCWDWEEAYPLGSVTDYRGATAGRYRVFRGGCWDYNAKQARSAYRRGEVPGAHYTYIGFRLVQTLP